MADQLQNDSPSRQSTPSRHTSPKNATCNQGLHKNTGSRKGLPLFNSYMSLFQVQEKLKKGEVIEVSLNESLYLL